MDIASLIGLLACLGLMIFGITGGTNFGAMASFIDMPSVFITFGGAFGATLAMNTMETFVAGVTTFPLILKPSATNMPETITQIMNLANVARKEGLLSLEEAAGNIEDKFLKKGIMLVVDGTDPELVRAIMETEMDAIAGRHKAGKTFWESLGAMGPAWGMIGTLIGLVNMLKNLSDSAAIGPAMAVALLTTFYGSLLSNWICTPVANKLGAKDAEEMMVKGIQVEGLLSIQAGENPRVIEEKLKSYLSPKIAAGFSTEDGGGEGGAG
ncbi:MAG: motility protein A [Lachnospiraceae bacterium]|nr:motility protein A [Lachnospiraceae bacterium]